MSEGNSWNVYRTRFLVRARQLTQPLVFTDLFGREHSGQPGDYLVETSDGIRRITSRALFEDIYVPLTRGSNTPPVNRGHPCPAPGVLDRRLLDQRVLDRPGAHVSAGEHARATA